MKKQFYNDSMVDTSSSVCLETNNIEHNNYIIDNNIDNTLPVEANNIVLDKKISHKIISLFLLKIMINLNILLMEKVYLCRNK